MFIAANNFASFVIYEAINILNLKFLRFFCFRFLLNKDKLSLIRSCIRDFSQILHLLRTNIFRAYWKLDCNYEVTLLIWYTVLNFDDLLTYVIQTIWENNQSVTLDDSLKRLVRSYCIVWIFYLREVNKSWLVNYCRRNLISSALFLMQNLNRNVLGVTDIGKLFQENSCG